MAPDSNDQAGHSPEDRGLRPAETPMTAADRLCDRIEAVDAEILAFLPEPGRRARLRAEARALAERDTAFDRLPLYGVPVAIKDIVRVAGLPTRAGSELPAELLDGPQAPLVDRLRAAGALVAGKTVTAEFAGTAPGPTRNPHHLGHTPGGSSSGSAAAVAAGMVPLAIGTQTVGSVIRPAAYCGVIGFKPGYDRVPTEGVIPNVPSLDTVGLFAADLELATRAAGVLCDRWQQPAPTTPRPRLAVPEGPYLGRAEPAALAAFEEHTARLAAAGHEILRVPFLDDLAQVEADQYTVNRFETARVHADWFARHGDRYRPQTAAAIRQGQAVDPDDYTRALRARERFRDRLRQVMADRGIDLWLTPAATGPAPRGLESTGSGAMCLPWSYAGVPALALPAGPAPDGLPLGVQCVAASGADERLLAWAPDLLAALTPPGGTPRPRLGAAHLPHPSGERG
ncbi:amidase [Streptomyces palmae]|uniref:Amidase n=1 Tax=Streptomyces palmae TaxID=1701085 RepID=A0A4Z0HGK9_9ACTN|nr:amidase [Streptomyces palmae]TGB18466.1 amidase [Streptomyces palmae]